MTEENASREVSCTLTEEQRSSPSEDVRSSLAPYYTGYEDSGDALRILFEGGGEGLRAVARFTAEELRCCSFADYEISISPPHEEIVLRVEGPEGTVELFREGVISEIS